MEDLRYPIGKYQPKESYTPSELSAFISRIEQLPAKMEAAVKGLTEEQLDTPYREGGWTVRQVVHHVSDSHSNAYIRLKWTLTENTPTIKAYNEKTWAETPDTQLPPAISVAVLKALHVKWTELIKRLTPEDLARQFTHPETGKLNRLDIVLGLYAWHGEHHLTHITALKKRMGW